MSSSLVGARVKAREGGGDKYAERGEVYVWVRVFVCVFVCARAFVAYSRVGARFKSRERGEREVFVRVCVCVCLLAEWARG